MSKISLSSVGNISQNPTSAATTINDNFNTIQNAFDNTLSRDGTSPNTLGNSIDMNSNRILNLPTPLTNSEPLRLSDLNSFIGGGTVTNIPSGGTTGQVLAKNSNINYDVHWQNESADLVAGTNIAITGTTPATISTVTSPTFTHITAEGVTSTGATGTGSLVFNSSPSLITPALGTPSSGVLTNCTGLPSSSLTGLGTGVGTALTTAVNGSGAISLTTSPTFVTPVLGTPTSGTLTNCTGFPVSGLAGSGTGINTFLATPTSANLAAAITNETGSGALVFGTSPQISTPDIVGTATNNNANAGSVGEFISSNVQNASAVSLTTNVTSNITSISLTAGDWDLYAMVAFKSGGGTTNFTYMDGGISTTSATFVNFTDCAFTSQIPFASAGFVPGTGQYNIPPIITRVSISSTTTYFLVAQATFTVSTASAYGYIWARRAR